jgi:hypothetical protein
MPREPYRYDDDDDDDRPRGRMRRHHDDEDDDDRPRRRRASRDEDDDAPREKVGNGLATASLVFGVLSFCTGITFIPGLICGFMGLSKSKVTGSGKGMAIAGLLTSAGGLFVSAAMFVGIYFLNEKREESKARYATSNNFKQAGIASHNYHDAMGVFPKPFCDETPGMRPPPRESELPSKLSWRVSLLPYVEQGSLYTRFNRSEPWDSPANKPYSQTVVHSYADADAPLDPATRIRCFYGRGTMFETDRTVTMVSVMDGTSNTILYVEGGEKVTWSQFNEYKFDPNGPLPALGHPKREMFAAALVDGSVRFIRKSVNPTTLKAAITRDGGEPLGYDW